MNIKIRPAKSSDEGFVKLNWKTEAVDILVRERRLFSKEAWAVAALVVPHAYARSILTIASLPEDEDTDIGWLAVDARTNRFIYLYVKPNFRPFEVNRFLNPPPFEKWNPFEELVEYEKKIHESRKK